MGLPAVVFMNDGGLQLNARSLGRFDLVGQTVKGHQFNDLSARDH